jgi:hypothetical protein
VRVGPANAARGSPSFVLSRACSLNRLVWSSSAECEASVAMGLLVAPHATEDFGPRGHIPAGARSLVPGIGAELPGRELTSPSFCVSNSGSGVVDGGHADERPLAATGPDVEHVLRRVEKIRAELFSHAPLGASASPMYLLYAPRSRRQLG